jgi:hypothetical protein
MAPVRKALGARKKSPEGLGLGVNHLSGMNKIFKP